VWDENEQGVDESFLCSLSLFELSLIDCLNLLFLSLSSKIHCFRSFSLGFNYQMGIIIAFGVEYVVSLPDGKVR